MHRVYVSQCAWEVRSVSEQFRIETAHEFHYSTERTLMTDGAKLWLQLEWTQQVKIETERLLC